jgi:hypothetical protein
MLQLKAKAMRLRETENSRDISPLENYAGDQAFAGELEDSGDLSTWSINDCNDFFGWDSVVDDTSTQSV